MSYKNDHSSPINAFKVKDCVLAPIATGIKAQSLIEFRDRLKIVPIESIYYHLWRQSIETSLIQGSFYNDFSNWAHYHLRDDHLAECLALIDPSDYEDLEVMRADIIEVVENRIDEQNNSLWFFASETFHFIKSNIIIFNSPYTIDHPKDLVKILPALSYSSIFYHFIDARRREKTQLDDFSKWMMGYNGNFSELIKRFRNIDPYFITIADLQAKLSMEVYDYFIPMTKNEEGAKHE